MWWLGARGVATSALWLLLVALGACVMQVQTDAWAARLGPLYQRGVQAPGAHAGQPGSSEAQQLAGGRQAGVRGVGMGWGWLRRWANAGGRGNAGWGLSGGEGEDGEERRGDLEAALLPPPPQQLELPPQQQQQQQQQQQRRQGQRGQEPARHMQQSGRSWDDALLARLFAPLDMCSLARWGWLDAARYLAIKHSIDVLLVSHRGTCLTGHGCVPGRPWMCAWQAMDVCLTGHGCVPGRPRPLCATLPATSL